jgi:hypothetical protein
MVVRYEAEDECSRPSLFALALVPNKACFHLICQCAAVEDVDEDSGRAYLGLVVHRRL